MLRNLYTPLQRTMTKAHQTKSVGWAITLLAGLLLYGVVVDATAQGTAGGSSDSKISAFTEQPTELLSVDDAFQVTLLQETSDSLLVNFEITPGHYLYSDRIDVASATDLVSINALSKPSGIETEDAFFGRTIIYREPVAVTVDLDWHISSDTPPTAVDIDVQYQGCSDIGICYPPQTKTFTLSVPQSELAQDGLSAKGLDLLSALNPGSAVAPADDLNSSSPVLKRSEGSSLQATLSDPAAESLLPPDIAFMVSVAQTTEAGIDVNFFAEPGYYLYKDKIKFTLEHPSDVSITDSELPQGLEQHDEFFGDVEVYRGSVMASALVSATEKIDEATLIIGYQGCADIGVCFPPQTTVVPVSLSGLALNTEEATVIKKAESGNAEKTAVTNNTQKPQLITTAGRTLVGSSSKSGVAMSEQDRLATTLSTSGIGWIILTFFGLGLLLAFTPCVFPMIPILSSIIAGQGEHTSTRKSFLLSLVYVLAMAVTYTVAGVFIGLSGENVQIWFQNPYVLSAFALIFVLLSLSMFGFYELQMPTAIQNRLNKLSNQQKGGSFYGVAIMGFLSALVVGPCVTAPLVGALIFIADTGDAVVGGTALFALSLGMGAPLLLIGTSFGTWLPRTGQWMEITKAFFGVMLLALAIWMLSRFLPAQATLFLSALLLIVTSVFMGAFDSTAETTPAWRKLAKGFGIVLMLYGASLLIGAFAGGGNLLKPLSGIATNGDKTSNGTVEASDELHFQRVKTTAELDALIADAASNNQSVMLDFYADWCISCKEMEAFTFSDRNVQARLSNTVVLQADVTANDADDKAMLKRFGLFGPPGIIFYTPDGSEIREARVVGFMAADKFSNHIDTHLGGG